MFNALIDYWYYTGDTQFNAITKQGLLFQVGPDDNYMVTMNRWRHSSIDVLTQ